MLQRISTCYLQNLGWDFLIFFIKCVILMEKWTHYRCTAQWIFIKKQIVTSISKASLVSSFVITHPKSNQYPDLWSMTYFFYLLTLCKRITIAYCSCWGFFPINLLYSTSSLWDSSILLCINFMVFHSMSTLHLINPFCQ